MGSSALTVAVVNSEIEDLSELLKPVSLLFKLLSNCRQGQKRGQNKALTVALAAHFHMNPGEQAGALKAFFTVEETLPSFTLR